MEEPAFAAPIQAPAILRFAPFLTALFFFILMTLLYISGDRSLYYGVISAWGVHPWPFPFLDVDAVLSAVRCLQRGVDVYAANPCDPLHRVYDYPPLWLALAWIPNAGEWLRPQSVGLFVDLIFLASLPLLPAGRGWRGSILVMIGTISTAAVFAVERANSDLVIFVLAIATAMLLQRSGRWRMLGYATALLAGLLKYYPMTLMLAATQERPRRFWAVVTASVVVLTLFLVVAGHDLGRALRLIPTGTYFAEMFGSVNLAGGLIELFGGPDILRPALRLAMIATSVAAGIAWGAGRSLQDDVGRLTRSEQSFLLIGAILLPSLFFTAQNIGYRAVHLLLVLPPVLALRQTGQQRHAHTYTVCCVIGLLWGDGWRHLVELAVDPFGPAIYNSASIVAWIVREGMWWWTITALVALATSLQLQSEMSRWTMQGIRRLLGHTVTQPPVAADERPGRRLA
jgi:hypothetical protein